MAISVKLFSDFKEILNIKDAWNQQIAFTSKNPLLHSGIFSRFMNYCEQNRWMPLVLTFWSGDTLVGMAPLKICKFLKLNRVCNIDDVLYSDFVFLDEYRDQCIDQLMDTVFNHLNCISAEITLDNNSPNFELMKKKSSTDKKLALTEKPDCGRATISLDVDYCAYYESLSRKSRKDFSRLERRLKEFSNSWTVSCVGVTDDSAKKVFNIDQKSWKSKWRKNNDLEEDALLRIILEASKSNREPPHNYESEIWFLEVNGAPVAYQIVLVYAGIACFVKTSYDKDFKRFSPGVILINRVIQHFFQKDSTKIDFVTDLPFVQSWKPLSQKRTKLIIQKKSWQFSIIRFIAKITHGFRKNISLLTR